LTRDLFDVARQGFRRDLDDFSFGRIVGENGRAALSASLKSPGEPSLKSTSGSAPEAWRQSAQMNTGAIF